MKKIKCFTYAATILFITCSLSAQEVILNGRVIADDEVEGIHIINKTAGKFSITNQHGEFIIPGKLNDTIIISGIKYLREEVIVNAQMYNSKTLEIPLTENINQLNEVIVGRVLTGDLRSDIENANIKSEINFYDVGIPGYTGKLKTQSERRLFEADNGKFFVFYGIGFAINVHKILNRISGRTKQLKLHVRLEALDTCMLRAKSEFSETLFGDLNIEDHLEMEFFYYVSEDPEFLEICKRDNAMEMYQFLVEKLVNYKENQSDVED
ncbi:hypothetical protein ACFO5O_14005 [Geojedonia litorea]|uniref:CarboxypepD_reg-like domain-containing protein n=1 Tax=Geojedonia litorea TaxID=1268269 RepID=A0ABV9N6L2_9FLAO